MTFSEIADLFGSVEGMDRLELLLDYADRLPPLPPEDAVLRDAGLGRVPECATPVYWRTALEDGRLRFYVYAPEDAPTTRGFLGVLVEAFEGRTPEEVLAAPADALGALGLSGLLGMQRTRGQSAIYGRLRRAAAEGTK